MTDFLVNAAGIFSKPLLLPSFVLQGWVCEGLMPTIARSQANTRSQRGRLLKYTDKLWVGKQLQGGSLIAETR